MSCRDGGDQPAIEVVAAAGGVADIDRDGFASKEGGAGLRTRAGFCGAQQRRGDHHGE